MRDLLKLLESCEGTKSLTMYVKDGLCWNKRGELRVTPKLIEELRRASQVLHDR